MSLVKLKAIVFTPWFGLMGLVVIAFSKLGIAYGRAAWSIRATLNMLIIVVSLCTTYLIEGMYA